MIVAVNMFVTNIALNVIDLLASGLLIVGTVKVKKSFYNLMIHPNAISSARTQCFIV